MKDIFSNTEAKFLFQRTPLTPKFIRKTAESHEHHYNWIEGTDFLLKSDIFMLILYILSACCISIFDFFFFGVVKQFLLKEISRYVRGGRERQEEKERRNVSQKEYRLRNKSEPTSLHCKYLIANFQYNNQLHDFQFQPY